MNVYAAKKELLLDFESLPVKNPTVYRWELEEYSLDELKMIVAVLHNRLNAEKIQVGLNGGHAMLECVDECECAFCDLPLHASRCTGEK